MRCATCRGAARRAQQPRQLFPVQVVAADDHAIQQQHRHIEAVTATQLRVRIDVDYLEGRQRQRTAERGEVREHLITQLTVAPMHDREPPGEHAQRPGAVASCAFSWLAMKRTVAGGTSPTAVILWPSTTVEKADEEPTVADSGTIN